MGYNILSGMSSDYSGYMVQADTVADVETIKIRDPNIPPGSVIYITGTDAVPGDAGKIFMKNSLNEWREQ